MSSLAQDLASLTQIPHHTLTRLQEQAELVVCHDLSEKLLSDQELVLDLGFGSLVLAEQAGELVWHFVPSHSFESKVVGTLRGKHSPLVSLGEEVLAKKIRTAYRDLIG